MEYYLFFSEEKITEAMDKIAECKNELIEAKTIRRNRQGLYIFCCSIMISGNNFKIMTEVQGLA